MNKEGDFLNEIFL